ncbi:MAG: PQQ-binding-like beta-propeller repeat protein [Planctomycetes bacterium]|nr:PQQ-binding-like beta-propeller repeat protein [Planctomycetota bacterium]
MKYLVAAILLLASLESVSNGADWPGWRGPTGQGQCDEKNLLLKWSDKENVKWKIPLENQGNSTPVIWGDKIFLTQANKGGSERSLICFARADGKLLWKKDVAYTEKERNWDPSWYANASPAVDGERVVVSFGSAGMYCYDFDGKELWKRTDLGTWEHAFGNGASPVLYKDLAILWCGPNQAKGRNFLLAVEKKSGKTVWETDEKFGSWSTPLITKVDGQDQLLLAFSGDVKGAKDDKTGFLKGYDPLKGTELWHCRGLDSYQYTSPLYGNGIAVGMSGYGGSAIAVKVGGTGDITPNRLWVHPKNTQRVGSGVLIGDHAYIMDENGMPRCYELKTGKEEWKVANRPGATTTWGSMVHADGRIYILMRNGQTLVFAAKPEYELLATNSLGTGEQTNSSIAISNGEIYIRTFKHLYCIGEKKK